MSMKLSCLLLLAVAAVVSADKSFYKPQRVQHQPESQSPVYSSYSYYDTDYDTTPEKGSWVDRILEGNRRQGLGGLLALFGGLGPGSVFGVFLAAILVILFVSTVAYLGAVLTGSGRGLDTDEWEVDHSVWMNQLQKDFEESWVE